MQPTNTEIANKANWQVYHDEETQLYYIMSEKGSKLNKRYTNRNFAQRALDAYLERMARPPRPVGRPRKDN